MTLQRMTIASLTTLGLGGLVTGAALVHAADFSTLFTGFGLLALSPYAVFCGAGLLANSSRGRAIVTLVVCALAIAGAIYFYGDHIFLNPRSMSGLVFFLVPAYQLPAAILLLIVVFFTRPRSRGKAKA